MTITLTTTDNQRNNIDNNVTTIDLNECEKVLGYIYNISNDKKNIYSENRCRTK